MQDKERTKWTVLGFIIGFIGGCGVGYLFFLLENWLSGWVTVIKPVKLTFGEILPFGIVLGLGMAAVMMTNYFGD